MNCVNTAGNHSKFNRKWSRNVPGMKRRIFFHFFSRHYFHPRWNLPFTSKGLRLLGSQPVSGWFYFDAIFFLSPRYTSPVDARVIEFSSKKISDSIPVRTRNCRWADGWIERFEKSSSKLFAIDIYWMRNDRRGVYCFKLWEISSTIQRSAIIVIGAWEVNKYLKFIAPPDGMCWVWKSISMVQWYRTNHSCCFYESWK